MKKILALVLAILMVASVLVACGESGGNGGSGGAATKDSKGGNTPQGDNSDPFKGEDNIELLVWCADKAVDLTNELCNDFIAQYPEKNIKITVQVQGEGDAAAQVLKDKDEAADVFSFACDQLTRLYDGNALAPVFNTAPIVERNSEQSVEAGTINGQLFAFPETGDNGYYLVYDKRVVSDEDAKTLEGVLEACKKQNMKFVVDTGDGFFACMFPFTGGLRLNGIENDVQQFTYETDEDAVVDTLVDFAELFHKYNDVLMSAEPPKISSGMAENNRVVGAGIDGSWNVEAVKKNLGENYGAAKLPTINGKQIYSMHGYKLIGVNARSKYPMTAQLLADYLTDEEAQLKRAKTLSWGPSNNEAVKDPSVTENIALAAIMEQAQYSVPQVNIVETFWSPMGTLGSTLWKDADYSRETIKSNYEKTIANIKDE